MTSTIWNHKLYTSKTNAGELFELFQTLLLKAGFTVLNSIEHHFKPQGYTCLFLLGESHLAIHTFPEDQTTYVELSSCNKTMFIEFINLLTVNEL